MKKHLNAYIGFYSFKESPRDLAEMLKIEPDKIRKKDEILDGGRIATKENAIIVYSKKEEMEELDTHVKDILDRIPLSIAGIEGIEIKLQVTVHIKEGESTPISAVCLESDTLNRLSKLGCSIDIDIYAYNQTRS